MFGEPLREWVFFKLLDAERNPLTFSVDRQHGSFDLLSFLVIPHSFLARQVPGDIGEMHQSVDAAVEADKDSEICNRFDMT